MLVASVLLLQSCTFFTQSACGPKAWMGLKVHMSVITAEKVHTAIDTVLHSQGRQDSADTQLVQDKTGPSLLYRLCQPHDVA